MHRSWSCSVSPYCLDGLCTWITSDKPNSVLVVSKFVNLDVVFRPFVITHFNTVSYWPRWDHMADEPPPAVSCNYARHTQLSHALSLKFPIVLCGIKLYLLKSTDLRVFYAPSVVLILSKYVSVPFRLFCFCCCSS